MPHIKLARKNIWQINFMMLFIAIASIAVGQPWHDGIVGLTDNMDGTYTLNGNSITDGKGADGGPGEDGEPGKVISVSVDGDLYVTGTFDLKGGKGGNGNNSTTAGVRGQNGGNGGDGGSLRLYSNEVIFQSPVILLQGGIAGNGGAGYSDFNANSTIGSDGGNGGIGGNGGTLYYCSTTTGAASITLDLSGGDGGDGGHGGIDIDIYQCGGSQTPTGQAGNGGNGGNGGAIGTVNYDSIASSSFISQLFSYSACLGSGGSGGNGGYVSTLSLASSSSQNAVPGNGGDGGDIASENMQGILPTGCSSLSGSRGNRGYVTKRINTTSCHDTFIDYGAYGLPGGTYDAKNRVSPSVECSMISGVGQYCDLPYAVYCGAVITNYTLPANLVAGSSQTPCAPVGYFEGRWYTIVVPRDKTLQVTLTDADTGEGSVAIYESCGDASLLDCVASTPGYMVAEYTNRTGSAKRVQVLVNTKAASIDWELEFECVTPANADSGSSCTDPVLANYIDIYGAENSLESNVTEEVLGYTIASPVTCTSTTAERTSWFRIDVPNNQKLNVYSEGSYPLSIKLYDYCDALIDEVCSDAGFTDINYVNNSGQAQSIWVAVSYDATSHDYWLLAFGLYDLGKTQGEAYLVECGQQFTYDPGGAPALLLPSNLSSGSDDTSCAPAYTFEGRWYKLEVNPHTELEVRFEDSDLGIGSVELYNSNGIAISGSCVSTSGYAILSTKYSNPSPDTVIVYALVNSYLYSDYWDLQFNCDPILGDSCATALTVVDNDSFGESGGAFISDIVSYNYEGSLSCITSSEKDDMKNSWFKMNVFPGTILTVQVNENDAEYTGLEIFTDCVTSVDCEYNLAGSTLLEYEIPSSPATPSTVYIKVSTYESHLDWEVSFDIEY